MLPAMAIRKLRGHLSAQFIEPKPPSSLLVDSLPLPSSIKPVWLRLPYTFKIASIVGVGALVYIAAKAVHHMLTPIAKMFGYDLFRAQDVPVVGPLFKLMGLEFDAEASVHADTVTETQPASTDTSRPSGPLLRVTDTPKINFKGLGSLVIQAESGGRPGMVSTGKGDAGGVSYGLYQFATNRGVPDAYVKQSRYRDEFQGMRAGTPEFSEVWRRIAKREPDAFGADQQAFAVASYFTPVANAVNKATGVDISKRSAGLQEMAFGTSVQYGPDYSSRTIIAAINAGNTSDQQIIQHVQSYKASRVDTNFRSSSQNIRDSVAKRIQRDYNKYSALANGEYTTPTAQAAPQPAPAVTTPARSTATPSRTAVSSSPSVPQEPKAERRDVVSHSAPQSASQRPTATAPSGPQTTTSLPPTPSVFRGANGALFSY